VVFVVFVVLVIFVVHTVFSNAPALPMSRSTTIRASPASAPRAICHDSRAVGLRNIYHKEHEEHEEERRAFARSFHFFVLFVLFVVHPIFPRFGATRILSQNVLRIERESNVDRCRSVTRRQIERRGK